MSIPFFNNGGRGRGFVFHQHDPYQELMDAKRSVKVLQEEVEDLEENNHKLLTALDDAVNRLKKVELILDKHRLSE